MRQQQQIQPPPMQQQPQSQAPLLPPRVTNNNLDDSLHANFGYNESTKRAQMLQKQAESTSPNVMQKTQSTKSNMSSGSRVSDQTNMTRPALRPGPVGPQGHSSGGVQHVNNVPNKGPLPQMNRPTLPQTAGQGPNMGMNSFNPAAVQNTHP